jgi:integrase
MPDIINLDFDPAVAKRLKDGESIAFPEAPGLRMERSGSGWRWIYRYRSPIDGVIRQIWLGNWPVLKPHRALVAWEDRRAERNAGRDPAQERRTQNENTRKLRDAPRPKTVAAVVAAHLEALGEFDPEKKAPRRTEHGRLEVERMFEYDLATIAKRKAAEIGDDDAEKFLEKIVRRGSPNTALRLRRELAAAWRTAKLRPNPWPEALGRRLAQGERDRVLTAGEVRALLRYLPNYGALVADALELTLRTALRSGEVVMLRSAWFEEMDGVLTLDIPATFMKARRPHRVPLVGRARAIVEPRLTGEFLFPSPLAGRHIVQKTLGYSVHFHSQSSETRPEIERPRCPVDDWAPHDLRRTAATLLGDLQCPFEVIESILAHRLPGVAAKYQRSQYGPQKIEWIGKLNAHIDAIAASETLRQLPRRKASA